MVQNIPQTNISKHAYVFLLLLEVLLTFFVYLIASSQSWEIGTRISVFWGILVLITHFIYKLSFRPINWMAPDTLYLMAFFCFHFGYLALWAIGLVPRIEGIFIYPELYPKVMLIVNLGMVGFIIGYIMFAPDRDFIVVKMVPSFGWTVVGIVLMAIALAIHLAYIYIVGLSTFVYKGYHVSSFMQDYVSDPRLWRLQPHIFALGLALYLVSIATKTGKILSGKLGLCLFSFYVLLLILEGGRTQIVTVGAIIVFVRHYIVKPFKFKAVMMMGIGALFLFGAIAVVRNVTALNLSKASEELKHAKQSGLIHWYDPLVEMGGSVRTINLTANLVPDEQPYWYGKSYLQSIIHIVPFLQGGLLYGKLGVGPAQWTTYTYYGYGSSGTGFSIAGEGYLNFGIPGALLNMIFIGAILSKVYSICIKYGSPEKIFILVLTLGILMVSVRNETNVIFAPIVQAIIFVKILKFCFPPKPIDSHLEGICTDE